MLLVLTGSTFAQTVLVGSIWGGKNWHQVYIDDTGFLTVPTPRGTIALAYGTYTIRSDNSPGYITLMKQDWGTMARVLAHEICHARQQDAGKPQSEKGCN